MNTFFSWLKITLISIIVSTLIILLFRYVFQIEIDILRIICIYFVLCIMGNISWLIKKKNIKFNKIKYSVIIGILYWGMSTATLMNLLTNNPFKLYLAIISYIVFMIGGFLWGIITYTITKRIKNKTPNNVK